MGKTVAVLFGGPSNEHEISCLSARTVLTALVAAEYEVYPVAVDSDLTWRFAPAALNELNQVSGRLPNTLDVCGSAITQLDADIAFPVLHGAWGEDGGVQRELNQLGIPFVGSDAEASELAMDKTATKNRLIADGVKVVSGVTVNKNDWQQQLAKVLDLGENLFVKPRHGGSSLGVSHITNSEQLPDALKEVFAMADEALVESAIASPREIEIGILQSADGNIKISVCGEVKLKSGFDFYDYQAKYLADGAELIVPASLSPSQISEFENMAQRAFQSIGCAGLARIDFLMSSDNQIFLNEVNTMPGFTQISMYPRMFAASGIELPELVKVLVEHGLSAQR
jgi:D-alanine-D-alanine ligase